MERSFTRREFIAFELAALAGLAGCTASASSCGPGEDSINSIRKDNRLTDVHLKGTVIGTYEENESGRRWFNIGDTSGTALVFPAADWRDKVPNLDEDQCVNVAGRVTETYEGEYTTCVDPGDSTCSFLSTDIKVTEATWDAVGSP